MLVPFITVIHVFCCLVLILSILLQAGKEGGMGAAFGGGGSGTVFGGRGAGGFLGKVTAACAAIFFLTSLSLSFLAVKGSVVTSLPTEKAPIAAPAATPAEPAAAPDQNAAPSEPAAAPAVPDQPAADHAGHDHAGEAAPAPAE